jgi:hypothetical protein
MMQLSRTLAVVCLAGVAACTQPTPYQPREDGYGFSSIQLEPNRYRVSFYGNTATSRETVETYLLFRAAQLTLEVDGDHFQVVERETERDINAYSNPGPFYGSSLFYGYRSYGGGGYYRPYSGPFYGASFGVGSTRVTETFEATVEFLAFRGPKPPDDPMSYDAHEIVANLGPSIRYPTP